MILVLWGFGADENGGHILVKLVSILPGNRVQNRLNFALFDGQNWLKVASWLCVIQGQNPPMHDAGLGKNEVVILVLWGFGAGENGGDVLVKSVSILPGNRVQNRLNFALFAGQDWLKIASWLCVILGQK